MGACDPLPPRCGCGGGAALGAVAGWLRGRFGTNEVLSTLMLNGLMAVVVTWLYGRALRDGAQVHTRDVVAGARGSRWRAPRCGPSRGSGLNRASRFARLGLVALAALGWYLGERTRRRPRIRGAGRLIRKPPSRARHRSLAHHPVRAMALPGALARSRGVALRARGEGLRGARARRGRRLHRHRGGAAGRRQTLGHRAGGFTLRCIGARSLAVNAVVPLRTRAGGGAGRDAHRGGGGGRRAAGGEAAMMAGGLPGAGAWDPATWGSGAGPPRRRGAHGRGCRRREAGGPEPG
ncbi:MAG: hypothetical protein IPF99_37085 [Deltaproteobacteria bacterium]|nr:hypothetical protein [Deltaproteobacteria bacterium]